MSANANSPFLAERLIARLSPLRRGNLARRIRSNIWRMESDLEDGRKGAEEAIRRLEAMLGRLAALS